MKTSIWTYLGAAALLLTVAVLPNLLTQAPPSRGDLDQEILAQLEQINRNLSQLASSGGLNRPMASNDLALSQPVVQQAQRQPVRPETEQNLQELIQELRRTTRALTSAGPGQSTWQNNSIRQNFQISAGKNQKNLQATLTRIGDDEKEFWKEFLFRSLSEILSDLGTPDEITIHEGMLHLFYYDISFQWQGIAEDGYLNLRFMDGICVAGDAG